MPNTLSPADRAKQAAARAALDYVESGMILGLGTGSTAAWFVRLLSERIKQKRLNVNGIATSSTTTWLARELGIPLRTLDEVGHIDLTVDGADEFDDRLNLIKGGGAALLQEKIVARASRRMLVVADEGKRVETLGRFPLPVEIVRFGTSATRAAIADLLCDQDVDGREITLRMKRSDPLVTDEGHHILDLNLGRIGDPEALAARLSAVPGVVEHGIFIGLADAVIVGDEEGATRMVAGPGCERAARKKEHAL